MSEFISKIAGPYYFEFSLPIFILPIFSQEVCIILYLGKRKMMKDKMLFCSVVVETLLMLK